jgi:hypothetical protein
MIRLIYVLARHRQGFFSPLPPSTSRSLELYWVARLKRTEREAYHLTLPRIEVTNMFTLALKAGSVP